MILEVCCNVCLAVPRVALVANNLCGWLHIGWWPKDAVGVQIIWYGVIVLLCEVVKAAGSDNEFGYFVGVMVNDATALVQDTEKQNCNLFYEKQVVLVLFTSKY